MTDRDPLLTPHPSPLGPHAWVIYPAVFCTTFGVLLFEISITRTFSVLLRFYFVFLTISAAICGLGLGGMASIPTRKTLRRLGDDRLLAILALLSGVSMPAVLFALLSTPLSRYLPHPLVIPAFAMVPFFFAGAFLSFAFHIHAARSGFLYGADLAGASLGALGTILLLNALGGINAPVAAGLWLVFAGLILAISGRRVGFSASGAVLLLAIVALLVANRDSTWLKLPTMPMDSQAPKVKPLYQELGNPQVFGREWVVASEWNAFARTDVVTNEDDPVLYVYTDGDVPTNLIPFDGDLAKVLPLVSGFIGLPGMLAGPRDRVLFIGPGGGLDILLGLMAGAKEMVGVELNPSIPRLMYQFRQFNGSIYAYDNFHLVVGEGRHFVRRSRDRYDVIYMALTRTATTETSSLALVESYVQTREAYRDYLDHLTPGGRIVFVTEEETVARRALLTVLSVLRDRGVSVAEAAHRAALLALPRERLEGTPYRYMLIVRKQPWSEGKARDLVRLAGSFGLEALFVPPVAEDHAYLYRLSRGEATLEEYEDSWEENLAPVTDDAPFFTDVSKGLSAEHKQLLAVVAGCVAVCILLFFSVARGTPRTARGRLGVFFAYFGLLGLAFMMVEVGLAQKLNLFLGYPTLTLSVVIFGLLLGGGLGSLFSQRWGLPRLPARIAAVAVIIAGVGTLFYLRLTPALMAVLPLPLFVRSTLAMLLVLGLGFCLGMPFPSGLRLAAEDFGDHLPRFWGVNGIMSPAGSILAMMGAKFIGFSGTLWVGSLLYLGVVALMGALAKKQAAVISDEW